MVAAQAGGRIAARLTEPRRRFNCRRMPMRMRRQSAAEKATSICRSLIPTTPAADRIDHRRERHPRLPRARRSGGAYPCGASTRLGDRSHDSRLHRPRREPVGLHQARQRAGLRLARIHRRHCAGWWPDLVGEANRTAQRATLDAAAEQSDQAADNRRNVAETAADHRRRHSDDLAGGTDAARPSQTSRTRRNVETQVSDNDAAAQNDTDGSRSQSQHVGPSQAWRRRTKVASHP